MADGTSGGAPRGVIVRGTVPGSVHEVWAVLADVRSWPQWLPTVTEVHPSEAAAPDGLGAVYEVAQPRLGRARWQITDWRPGAGFTWVSRRPGVTSTGIHEIRPSEDDPSRSVVRLGIDWSGPLAWFARLAYGRMARRYVEAELAALSARVADAGPGGASG